MSYAPTSYCTVALEKKKKKKNIRDQPVIIQPGSYTLGTLVDIPSFYSVCSDKILRYPATSVKAHMHLYA